MVVVSVVVVVVVGGCDCRGGGCLNYIPGTECGQERTAWRTPYHQLIRLLVLVKGSEWRLDHYYY